MPAASELVDCGGDLSGAVDASQRLERRWIEGLRAERYAVDAGPGIAREPAVLDRAGVRLHCYFDVRGEGQARLESLDQRGDRLDTEQRRRPAAEEDTADSASCCKIEVTVEIGQQGRDIFLFRNAVAGGRAS